MYYKRCIHTRCMCVYIHHLQHIHVRIHSQYNIYIYIYYIHTHMFIWCYIIWYAVVHMHDPLRSIHDQHYVPAIKRSMADSYHAALKLLIWWELKQCKVWVFSASLTGHELPMLRLLWPRVVQLGCRNHVQWTWSATGNEWKWHDCRNHLPP